MRQLLADCINANLIVDVKGDYLYVSWGDCEENEARELLLRLKENRKEFVRFLKNFNLRPLKIYELKPLIKYYIQCGWSPIKAIETAERFLVASAYMPEHEHSKYLQVVEKGFFDETAELTQ